MPGDLGPRPRLVQAESGLAINLFILQSSLPGSFAHAEALASTTQLETELDCVDGATGTNDTGSIKLRKTVQISGHTVYAIMLGREPEISDIP